MKSITISDGTNTFSLSNTSSTAYLDSYEGFEYPQIIDVMENLPGRSGALYVDSDFGARVISIQGHIMGTQLTQRRSLQNVLKQGQLLTLKFTTYDDIQLQTNGYLRKIIMPYNRAYQKFSLEFACPNHRFLSQTLSTNSTQVTVITGGTAIPTVIPLSLGSVGGTPALTVTNNGNENAQAEFIIYGAGTNFTVQNQTTGQSFTLNMTLLTNEFVTIDTANRTVTQSNGQNQYGSLSSGADLFDIMPGDNEIFFNASSGSDVNTQLVIKYRDSYRGV